MYLRDVLRAYILKSDYEPSLYRVISRHMHRTYCKSTQVTESANALRLLINI